MGSRQIVFDTIKNDYIYNISEPELNSDEKELKEELSRLFKMLADINITLFEKKEKEKFLEETLEQIIIDNNINFYKQEKPFNLNIFKKKNENNDKIQGKSTDKKEKISLFKKSEKKNDDKKGKLNLFNKKSKDEKTEEKTTQDENEQKKNKRFFFCQFLFK